MWPHHDAVAKRAAFLISDYRGGLDISKYTTTGSEDKRVEVKKPKKRNESPSKTTGSTTIFKQAAAQDTKHSTSKLVEAEAPLRQEHPKTESSKPKEEPKPSAKEEKKAAPDVLCGRHLKTAQDLTGFPTFPAETNSLLSKNLTREIWAKYHDAKDKFGFSFKEAIFSGCQNTDSSVGVYLGTNDSYHAF